MNQHFIFLHNATLLVSIDGGLCGCFLQIPALTASYHATMCASVQLWSTVACGQPWCTPCKNVFGGGCVGGGGRTLVSDLWSPPPPQPTGCWMTWMSWTGQSPSRTCSATGSGGPRCAGGVRGNNCSVMARRMLPPCLLLPRGCMAACVGF